MPHADYPLDPKPRIHVWRISTGDRVSCLHEHYGCGGKDRMSIEEHEHRDPNIDGAVWYELDYANGRHSYMRQPFARGEHRKHPTDKYSNGEASNIWGWDGNLEAPTLTPSYLCHETMTEVRVHLFLRAGQIDLCGDSNVVVG